MSQIIRTAKIVPGVLVGLGEVKQVDVRCGTMGHECGLHFLRLSPLVILVDDRGLRACYRDYLFAKIANRSMNSCQSQALEMTQERPSHEP